MIARRVSLRAATTALVLAGFVTGVAASVVWMTSDARWHAHRETAYIAGITLYSALQDGTAPARGIAISPLSPADSQRAAQGNFRQVSMAPAAARTTIVPIAADPANSATQPLTLVILSPDIVYPLAELIYRDGQTAAETTGGVLRLVASYCSDPVIVARLGDGDWVQVTGGSLWNCAAAPRDLRLLAAIAALVALAILVGSGQNMAAHFTDFARKLRSRRRLDGPQSYQTSGPQELQEMVAAVNSYLAAERAQIESRAEVLSGVSHDLGTPATRLRLRTALIADADLRSKLEADIDSMTGMIESVLTYTRAEMNAEEPRELSLNSLIDAIVADYQDTGHNVVQRPAPEVVVRGGRSVFMSRQGQSVVAADRQIVVVARPIALERAITNLINNALQYGRRAIVGIEADSDTATIVVDDEGAVTSAAQIKALTAPFQRGENAARIEGYGLGLTIVATIANLHGGSLSFEDSGKGLSARLTIQRG